jgi:hypothetical protein
MGSISGSTTYSPVKEAERIFHLLCDQAEQLNLPSNFAGIKRNVVFKSDFDRVYFPIPLKETEAASALKGVEGGVASALAELKTGQRERKIEVDLEKATSFLFQSYLATIGGLGKLDEGVRSKLKGTTSKYLFLRRHRSVASTVGSISTNVGESLRNEGGRSLLSHPWLTRSEYYVENDWP